MKVTVVGLFSLFLFLLGAAKRSGPTIAMSVSMAMLPPISYVVGRRAMRLLDCRREGPEFTHEDEPVEFSVHFSTNPALLGTVEAKDTLPQWIELAAGDEQVIRHESERIVISYRAACMKRGLYRIGPIDLRASDPLGFFTFGKSWPLMSDLVVLPRPLRIPELSIRPMGHTGEQQYEGAGARGSGIDFHGIREFRPGDELRRVHWRSTARRGGLNVVEFEHTKAEDAVIAIDVKSGSEIGTGRYTSLEYAVKIACALIDDAISIGSAVRLVCSGVDGIAGTSGIGDTHRYRLLTALALLQADRSESLTDVIAARLATLSDCSTLICISTKIDPAFADYAAILSTRGIGVHCILLTMGGVDNGSIERAAMALSSSGARLTVVACAGDRFEGLVKLNYD